MKKTFIAIVLASSAALAGMALPLTSAHAQSEASIALSALPVASVVGAASVAGAAATASVAVPAALSVGGATLTVISVQAVAGGTVYLLERASDGARVSINVSGKAANGVSAAVGSMVLVTVISSGVVISAAGEVLAFVPNAIGRALLHNEKLS
ncbi:conserved membrane hypothetical protein [Burkholderiales bacterium 8X]|nr:conserved membrane hypothetical protein [Burkholderiales bacterium 8X]